MATTSSSMTQLATRCTSALASLIRKRIEARKRSVEQEKEFYRKLNAYCRANNLSAICEDDWRTAAYSHDR